MAHRVPGGLLIVFAGLAACAGADVRAGATTPQEATYVVEGEAVTLVAGVAEQELVPGAASRQVTRWAGPAAAPDLDRDGVADAAVLLLRDGGGSGTFYYVAAALRTADGYAGTNALFLGDRIRPVAVAVHPQDPAQFTVTYFRRRADEPMSAEPSEQVSRTFGYAAGALVEVADAPEERQ